MIKHTLYRMIVALISLTFIGKTQAQTLFTVNNESITVDEFKRQFLKNLDLSKQKVSEADLKEYLKLYTNFKLKLADAKANGLDTTEAYKQEMAMYRQQLAANYLVDKEVTEQLIQEAYTRMKYHVRSAHVLVLFPKNYQAKDTVLALEKINEAYKEVISGKISFEDAAKKYSEDQGTAENGGDLGFFTALDLVYPFENAAYNTPIGKISNVFRTSFGYHFLKSLDKKENIGEIEASTILIRSGKGAKISDEEGEKKITEIYNLLTSGKETMEESARKYSEDFDTKYRGGSMGNVSIANFVGDLDKQAMVQKAFELKKEGDFSKPFLTEKGWLLIRRGELTPLASYEKSKGFIKSKIQNDERSRKSVESLIQKIKTKEFKNIEGLNLISYLIKQTNNTFDSGKWKFDDMPKLVKYGNINPASKDKVKAIQPLEIDKLTMFQIGTGSYSYADFIKVLKEYYPVGKSLGDNRVTWVTNLYESYQKDKLLNYQNDNLESLNDEFKFIYQEYKEGILMFNRQQEMVWEKSNTDSIGLSNFYSLHKNEYNWPDRFLTQIYTTNDKKTMKGVFKAVKKGIPTDSILRVYNKSNTLNVEFNNGKYAINDGFLLPDSQVLKVLFNDAKYRKTNNKLYKLNQVNKDWVVVKIEEFLPSGPKSLDENRGVIAAQYQDYLEKTWIEKLAKENIVTVNNSAFNSLVTELTK